MNSSYLSNTNSRYHNILQTHTHTAYTAVRNTSELWRQRARTPYGWCIYRSCTWTHSRSSILWDCFSGFSTQANILHRKCANSPIFTLSHSDSDTRRVNSSPKHIQHAMRIVFSWPRLSRPEHHAKFKKLPASLLEILWCLCVQREIESISCIYV